MKDKLYKEIQHWSLKLHKIEDKMAKVKLEIHRHKWDGYPASITDKYWIEIPPSIRLEQKERLAPFYEKLEKLERQWVEVNTRMLKVRSLYHE